MSPAVHRNKRGVTLLELILVMVLIGILSSIIIVPVLTAARAWSEMSLQKEAVDQARIGLDRFVRELRAIQRVNGRPSIPLQWLDQNNHPVFLGENRIRFVMATGQDLEYSWAGVGQPLVRTDWSNGGAPDNAALNVQGFTLCYYEDSNASFGQAVPVPAACGPPGAQIRQEAEGAPSPPITCSPGPCDIQGTVVRLNAVDDSIAYGFTGTGVVWIGPKDSNLGKAKVHVDTDSDVFVDQYASVPPSTPQPLFTWHPVSPTYGFHTITIGCCGTQNPLSTGTAIKVDAFDRLVSRVVVNLTVGLTGGGSQMTTSLRDQVSFRSVD